MKNICVKTGMDNEAHIARQFFTAPGVQVLQGAYTVAELDTAVTKDCEALMSFGMCGGLRKPLPIVGQTVMASTLIAADGSYRPDTTWTMALQRRTKAYTQLYYSTAQFDTADTPAQRAQLYADTAAWVIDDESWAVAALAQRRGIPFVVIRNVSDAWNDNVAITSNILNKSGGVDPLEVLADIIEDPLDMIAIGIHFMISNNELRAVAQLIGPNCGF